jgi:phosphoglycerate kinase
MKYGIKTLDDFNFQGKTVFARLDLNSPYDPDSGKLKDTTRIEKAIPTIVELSQKGAKLVLLTHQGGDLEYHNYISTELHGQVISKLAGRPVGFIDDVCGPCARETIKGLKPGQILLLDNVRYMAEEMTLFETKLKLSPSEQAETIVVSKLSPLADFYVCDAFAAAHRDQPTLVGFEEILPSAMGRLFEAEYGVLSKIMKDPDHPVVFILGGAKIEDAFNMMPKVLSENIADKILSAGLLGQLFLMAKDVSLGQASEEVIYAKKLDEYMDEAKKIIEAYPDQIITPEDFAYVDGGRKEAELSGLPLDDAILDLGSSTIEMYKDILSKAKTVFINGPAGVFEKPETEKGTRELFTHTAASDAFSVIGGGDSITAAKKFGLEKDFSYMCTGGGAMVRFLSGEELPVVTALKKGAKNK